MPGPFELPGDLLVWFVVALTIGLLAVVALVFILAKLCLLYILFGHDDLDLGEERP